MLAPLFLCPKNHVVIGSLKENSFRSKKEIKDYLQNKNASKIIDSLRDEDRVLYNGKAKNGRLFD